MTQSYGSSVYFKWLLLYFNATFKDLLDVTFHICDAIWENPPHGEI